MTASTYTGPERRAALRRAFAPSGIVSVVLLALILMVVTWGAMAQRRSVDDHAAEANRRFAYDEVVTLRIKASELDHRKEQAALCKAIKDVVLGRLPDIAPPECRTDHLPELQSNLERTTAQLRVAERHLETLTGEDVTGDGYVCREEERQ